MKSIKTFEEFEYEDPDIESELGVLPYETNDISPEELEKMMSEITSGDDIEYMTKELVKVRKKYSPKENDKLKDIWWKHVGIWYKLFDKLGKPPEKLIMHKYKMA